MGKAHAAARFAALRSEGVEGGIESAARRPLVQGEEPGLSERSARRNDPESDGKVSHVAFHVRLLFSDRWMKAREFDRAAAGRQAVCVAANPAAWACSSA
jgi:hypothetical protein